MIKINGPVNFEIWRDELIQKGYLWVSSALLVWGIYVPEVLGSLVSISEKIFCFAGKDVGHDLKLINLLIR